LRRGFDHGYAALLADRAEQRATQTVPPASADAARKFGEEFVKTFPGDSAPVVRDCPRCGKPVTDGRGGCEGAQHGNRGCAMNSPPWTCFRCGQLNTGWATECGRCEAPVLKPVVSP
jgi:hypothetical protein